MKFILCLLLCACVLQKSYVDCDLVEKIKAGASSVKQSIHCGFHKVKSAFVAHEHTMDPCDKNSGKGNEDESSEPERTTEDEGVTYEINVRGQEDTTPGLIRERRVLAAGSNCPSGYVSDKNGNCFEAF